MNERLEQRARQSILEVFRNSLNREADSAPWLAFWNKNSWCWLTHVPPRMFHRVVFPDGLCLFGLDVFVSSTHPSCLIRSIFLTTKFTACLLVSSWKETAVNNEKFCNFQVLMVTNKLSEKYIAKGIALTVLKHQQGSFRLKRKYLWNVSKLNLERLIRLKQQWRGPNFPDMFSDCWICCARYSRINMSTKSQIPLHEYQLKTQT